jgi:hypothetical protein
MLSLEHIQSRLASFVIGGEPIGGLSGLVTAGAGNAQARLRVYQNHTRSSLTSTLMTVFPVTVRLVDERFFRYAASEFIRRQPPREPRLVRYGEALPRFLRSFHRLADKPFVAETARLEWAIAEALDAASPPACPISALQPLSATSPELRLQPSLRLIASHWPVLSIWSEHQQDAAAMPRSHADRSSQRVALWRSGDRLRFAMLDPAEFAFRHALAHDQGLERAASRALAQEPLFDLVSALSRLFGDGLVTEVGQACPSPRIDGEFHDDDF